MLSGIKMQSSACVDPLVPRCDEPDMSHSVRPSWRPWHTYHLCACVSYPPQVVVTTKIGEGAFGEVSRAEVFPYGTVAIKWLKVRKWRGNAQAAPR